MLVKLILQHMLPQSLLYNYTYVFYDVYVFVLFNLIFLFINSNYLYIT